MNIYIMSEQVGLEGYWVTDILDGIIKESLKKNINVIDYDGSEIELTAEAPRPIVLVIGYSVHWMEEISNKLKKKKVFYILVNADQGVLTEMLAPIGNVSFAVRRACYDVLSYLISAKISKIAFFGAHSDTHSDDVKAEEFLNLSNLWGLKIGPEDIYRSNSIKNCFKKIQPFLENYNAVFCSSDASAAYFIEKCIEQGIKVPQDIAVVGFGNARISSYFNPSISSVENNYFELGRQAVKLHQLLQKNTDINSAAIFVDCPLIIRNSSPNKKLHHIPIIKNNANLSPKYMVDQDFMSALMAEELLKNWDDIDKAIAYGLINGKTSSAIADGLFISVSAIKYRIRKMLVYTNLKTKTELINLIKKYNLITK